MDGAEDFSDVNCWVEMCAPASLSSLRLGGINDELRKIKLSQLVVLFRVYSILVIDVPDHSERVGASDEVLHDYDCSFSACSFETAGAALEHHVSGCDAGAKVHPTILDNCRKTIAVGSYIRDFAGRMGDVRVGVRQELNRAGTGEQSEVSFVTR